jgi:AraC family transcriptional regulator
VELVMRSDESSGVEMFNSDSGSLSLVAARLVDAACFARDGDYEAAQAYIAQAVALLRGEPRMITASARPPERGAQETVRGGLAAWQKRRLIAYIDTHVARRIRIENLAALLDLSVGHFCRAFKSTFGLSAHDYLMRRRIEVAQGLMLTTSDPLGAIALSCGMSDQSHFSRWFRRIVGETPHQWRRTRRGALEDHATELAYPSANRLSVSGPLKTATNGLPQRKRANYLQELTGRALDGYVASQL